MNPFSTIKVLVNALKTEIEHKSITPARLGSLLAKLVEACESLPSRDEFDDSVADQTNAQNDIDTIKTQQEQLKKTASSALALASNINDDLYGEGQTRAQIDGAEADVAELKTQVETLVSKANDLLAKSTRAFDRISILERDFYELDRRVAALEAGSN